MAWVRIHDGAMGSLKILRLSDSAFRLWVKGLCYCQTHLTDGLIPREWLRETRARRGDVEMLKAVLVDGKAPLWEYIDGFGFKVHDYLDWNDSRDRVLARREAAEAERDASRQRLANWRVAQRVKRECNAVTSGVTSAAPVTLDETPMKRACNALTKPNQTKPVVQQQSSGGGKRPIYTSDRFVVFEWQLDDLGRMLGPHFEDFDLHAFFDALTQQSRTRGLVIPADREKRWQWLQEQVLAEARRRGLPVAGEQAAVTRVNGCFHNPPCANASQHTKLHLAETA